MNLNEWAQDWKVPYVALLDLRARMGMAGAVAHAETGADGSESRQQSLVRLDSAANGVWLSRNNVGALPDRTGRMVRYGLCNETAEQNKRIKSSDLIGVRPVLIEAKHVGGIIGQFVARECKHESWTYKGDAHELAQLNFINFICAKGGDAKFATGAGSF